MIDRLTKHELAWDDIMIDSRYDDEEDEENIDIDYEEDDDSYIDNNGYIGEYTTLAGFVMDRLSQWMKLYPHIQAINNTEASLVESDTMQKKSKDDYTMDLDDRNHIEIEVDGEDIQEEERQEENYELINNLVGPRTLLWLIIPQFAVVSIFAHTCIGSPPFLLTKKAEKYFAPMIVKNIMVKARELELAEGNHVNSAEKRRVKWTLYLKAASLCSENSRAVRIVQNYFEFALTIGILYGAINFWLAMSFIIMVPIIFFRILDVYVLIGKKMGIHDYDFWWMFYFLDPQYYEDLKSQLQPERLQGKDYLKDENGAEGHEISEEHI